MDTNGHANHQQQRGHQLEQAGEEYAAACAMLHIDPTCRAHESTEQQRTDEAMLADAATVARIGEAAKLDVDLTGSDHSTEPIATTGDILADVKAVVDRIGPRRRSPLEFDIVQPPIIWSPLRLRKDLEQMRDRMVREDRRRCFPPC